MTLAARQPLEDETAGLLIEAAFDLLAKGGWGNFSLRAVADAIGAAGSAASHRFGDRAGLVAAVCDAALWREAGHMDRFLPGVQVETADELVAVLYEWLEQRVRWSRKQARACSELALVGFRDPAARGFGARWADLCRELVGRLHPGFGEATARALAAFLTAETPHWLLLADDPEFRLASREALGRIVQLGAPGLWAKEDRPLPVAWLRRGLDLPDARRAPDLAGTRLRIVEATAAILAEDGVQAVTHREIAKRSGASLSSLTYHFESLDDLLRHGFQHLFAAGVAAPGGPAAGYELTLQALRDPFLAPLAASVRRRLGESPQGAAEDLQAVARREAAAMLRTGAALAGGAAEADGPLLCAG